MIRNVKPLLSSLQTLLRSPNPQFIQKSPVSGTAKGKSKLKTGQPLKRSKITRKTSKPPSQGRGRMGGAMDRINRMVDSCLNAPTPVRYLTPKDKQREAEREKLGLISKDKQRQIDNQKKKKQDELPIMGTPGMDLITLGLVDADKIPKYELTVEDGRRLAKEYSRVLMRRHRARQAAESTLLRLKKEAIEALPENLKATAMVPDLTPFPVNRFMATLTPPIEGYIESIREAARKNIGKEKLR
ncbi:uncharacterized protein LOC143845560 [Tasmannia lanceolata]|uniref:uncharacterized protein LOC143845560 n=1 Tax=Tasmannia lanceolata TaxID=3420 RepID=UPI0040628BD6